MGTEFLKYTRSMNAMLKTRQETEKEVITDETAARAISYINNMEIKAAGDLLLYCSALNVCNAYVKQDNAKIGYFFKSKAADVIDAICDLDLEDVYIDYQKDKGMTLFIVQIGDIQFSYHTVKLTPKRAFGLEKTSKRKALVWDGVRKQRCAATTLYLAEFNKHCRTLKTNSGKALLSKIESDAEKMLSGQIEFKVN